MPRKGGSCQRKSSPRECGAQPLGVKAIDSLLADQYHGHRASPQTLEFGCCASIGIDRRLAKADAVFAQKVPGAPAVRAAGTGKQGDTGCFLHLGFGESGRPRGNTAGAWSLGETLFGFPILLGGLFDDLRR